MRKTVSCYIFFKNQRNKQKPQHSPILIFHHGSLRQHRTIPALRLKHRSGGCGTVSALPKCSIMSGCGTRIVLRGQKPLALRDRCPCFGSLFPPLAALTFAASSIICAFGLASAAPRSPYRHLELCGIALYYFTRSPAAFQPLLQVLQIGNISRPPRRWLPPAYAGQAGPAAGCPHNSAGCRRSCQGRSSHS